MSKRRLQIKTGSNIQTHISNSYVKWDRCLMIDILVNNGLITSCDIMHGIGVASLPVLAFGRRKLPTGMRYTST